MNNIQHARPTASVSRGGLISQKKETTKHEAEQAGRCLQEALPIVSINHTCALPQIRADDSVAYSHADPALAPRLVVALRRKGKYVNDLIHNRLWSSGSGKAGGRGREGRKEASASRGGGERRAAARRRRAGRPTSGDPSRLCSSRWRSSRLHTSRRRPRRCPAPNRPA